MVCCYKIERNKMAHRKDYAAEWADQKKKMVIEGTLLEYREKVRLRVAKSRQLNKLKNKEQAKTRRENDDCYRLKNQIGNMCRRAINNPNYDVYIPYVDMWSKEFRLWIKAQWENWMNWRNHGNYNKKKRMWQIDHLTPLSRANGDVEELKKLLHFTNVRPKCAHQNICEREK